MKKETFKTMYLALVTSISLAGCNAPQVSNKTDEPPSDTVSTEMGSLPHFPGGTDRMMEFLMNKVEYPTEALNNKETGKVSVSFTVGTTGKLSHFEVTESASPLLDAEVLRIAKEMPNWVVCKKRGVPKDGNFSISVYFSVYDGDWDISMRHGFGWFGKSKEGTYRLLEQPALF